MPPSAALRSSSTRQNTLLSLGIFLASLCFFSFDLGNRPFVTRGEGREALVVSSMVRQSNYVLPLRNGQMVPSKPPMFHWIALTASKLQGTVNEFSVRFSSALCAAALVTLLFLFIAVRDGVRIAALGSLMFATSLEVLRGATHARVDMCFALFLTISFFGMFLLIEAFSRGQPKRRVAAWCAITVAGIAGAILAKGPAAVALVLGVLAAYTAVLMYRHGRNVLRRMPFGSLLLTVGLASTIAALWYLAAYNRLGEEFLRVQLFQENFARVVEVEGDEIGHQHAFFFVPLFLLQVLLPWSIFLPLVIGRMWRQRRELFHASDQAPLFCLVALVVFTSALMFSISRRDVYLLPTVPIMSYLLARFLCDEKQELRSSVPVRLAGYALATITFAAFLVLIGMFVPSEQTLGRIFSWKPNLLVKQPGLDLAIEPVLGSTTFRAAVFFFVALVALAARQSFRGYYPSAITWLGAGMIVIVTAVHHTIMPPVFLLSCPKTFMEGTVNPTTSGARLFQYQHEFFSAVYYADRDVPLVQDLDLKSTDTAYILARERDTEVLLREERSRSLVSLCAISSNLAANGVDQLALLAYRASPELSYPPCK